MSAIYNKYKLFYKVNVMDFIFLQHNTHTYIINGNNPQKKIEFREHRDCV
jgi:hypothetical protein